jgi:glutamyl-tRNA reductase
MNFLKTTIPPLHWIVVGISHKRSPIEIREKFYLNHWEQELLLSELKSKPFFLEGFVLSTCNRTEIYARTTDSKHSLDLKRALFDIKNLPFQEKDREHFYLCYDHEAVKHLLQVVTSLDSLVIGEKQILGQVKTAIEQARTRGLMGTFFNLLAQVAIRTGKKAQLETDISVGGSSMSWAAIVLANRTLQTLQNKKALLIGSGKMGTLAAKQLFEKGVSKIWVMNRTFSRAQELAKEVQGIPVPFGEIKDMLHVVDLVFCSAGAPHYLIEENTVSKVMQTRQERPLMLIDISIPRNIDPACSKVRGVHLCEMDDLQGVVQENIWKRKEAIIQVEAIIQTKIKEFQQKIEKHYSEPSEILPFPHFSQLQVSH